MAKWGTRTDNDYSELPTSSDKVYMAAEAANKTISLNVQNSNMLYSTVQTLTKPSTMSDQIYRPTQTVELIKSDKFLSSPESVNTTQIIKDVILNSLVPEATDDIILQSESITSMSPEQKSRRRDDRVNSLVTRLQLRPKSDCNEWELQKTFRTILLDANLEGDLITQLFFVQRMKDLLCDTTKALKQQSLIDAGMILVEGVKQTCKQFALNDSRLTMMRITIAKACTRAIINKPYENFAITTFRNFLDHRLPKPMTERMEIRERLTTLLGLKELLRKLRLTVWRNPIKSQRKALRGINNQITEIMIVTESNNYEDRVSLQEQEQIESDIESAFEGIDLEGLDFNRFTEMLNTY